MALTRKTVDSAKFNAKAKLPFELRLEDFSLALQDIYDFFHDVNSLLVGKGLDRLDDMLRPAFLSGVLSEMLTASHTRHSRALVDNDNFNGQPNLVVRRKYPNNTIKSGENSVEIK